MSDFGWAQPHWLWALPLAWFIPRCLGPLTLPYPGTLLHVRQPLPRALPDSPHTPLPTMQAWLGIWLALLIIAMAQPLQYGDELPPKPVPVDAVLLVDVTISMSLQDYDVEGERVDRLHMAKALLDRFAADFSGERLGIVVVGRPPSVWAPMTQDRDLIRHLLARLQLTQAGRNAALGDALQLTAEAFDTERPPVVILISDAAYPLGNVSPHQGADALKAAGMTLYSIGVGSEARTEQQLERGLIYAGANLTLLQSLAESTGGRFFHAQDSQAVEAALAWIEDKHSSLTPAPDSERQQEPLHVGVLLLAMLWLLLGPWWQYRGGQA